MFKPAESEGSEARAGKPKRESGSGRSVGPVGGPPPRRAGGGSALHVYKPGQGAHVRWGTAAAGGVVVLGLAAFVHEQLVWFTDWVRYLIPVALLVVLGYLVFRFVGQSRSVVDFMIATEGEMKKVNWSTRREVLGATKVVIVAVMSLGIMLFVVDIFFMFFFDAIDVLKVDMVGRLFSSGVQQ
jgi:preprotein translocase SecE subunit